MVKEGNWSQERSVEEKGRDRSEKGSQLNGRLVIRTQETVCDTNRIRREGGGVVGGSKRQLVKTAESGKKKEKKTSVSPVNELNM